MSNEITVTSERVVRDLRIAFEHGRVRSITQTEIDAYARRFAKNPDRRVNTAGRSLNSVVKTYGHTVVTRPTMLTVSQGDDGLFYAEKNCGLPYSGQKIVMVMRIDGQGAYTEIVVVGQTLLDQLKNLEVGASGSKAPSSGQAVKRSSGDWLHIEDPETDVKTLTDTYESFHATAPASLLDAGNAPIFGVKKTDKVPEIIDAKYVKLLVKTGDDLDIPGTGMVLRRYAVQLNDVEKERFQASQAILLAEGKVREHKANIDAIENEYKVKMAADVTYQVALKAKESAQATLDAALENFRNIGKPAPEPVKLPEPLNLDGLTVEQLAILLANHPAGTTNFGEIVKRIGELSAPVVNTPAPVVNTPAPVVNTPAPVNTEKLADLKKKGLKSKK